MSALVESRSLTAEIADCCRDIYLATEAEAALKHWTRLRSLAKQMRDEENTLFMRETRNGALNNWTP
jgi:hypothetical protein